MKYLNILAVRQNLVEIQRLISQKQLKRAFQRLKMKLPKLFIIGYLNYSQMKWMSSKWKKRSKNNIWPTSTDELIIWKSLVVIKLVVTKIMVIKMAVISLTSTSASTSINTRTNGTISKLNQIPQLAKINLIMSASEVVGCLRILNQIK